MITINKINITFTPTDEGTYDFEVKQNGRGLCGEECSATEKDESTGLTEAEFLAGFSRYLQDLADERLSKNPKFKWHTAKDFQLFAKKAQPKFWEVEDKYIDYPKA